MIWASAATKCFQLGFFFIMSIGTDSNLLKRVSTTASTPETESHIHVPMVDVKPEDIQISDFRGDQSDDLSVSEKVVQIFETTQCLVKFARSYRVFDEALIAETAVWPIFFLSYECFLCS